jgi:hypothetical protein
MKLGLNEFVFEVTMPSEAASFFLNRLFQMDFSNGNLLMGIVIQF